MSQRRSGLNPLAYLGVEPISPPLLVIENRAPTTNDSQNFNLGAIWLDRITENVYILVNLDAGVATWDLIAMGATGAVTELTADVGAAFPVAGVIKIAGGANINTSATGNVVTVNLNTSISQPNTNASGSQGLYSLGGDQFLHSFGSSNTFLGKFAGVLSLLTTAAGCTGIGAGALNVLTSGVRNTALGSGSLGFTTTGNDNTGCGAASIGSLTTGSQNSALGEFSLPFVTTGSNNIALGWSAGNFYTTSDSSNISIGNLGLGGESNAIRIGTQGSGAAQQNTCFIAGITGVTVANAQMVTINTATGQLGTTSGIISNWVDVTAATQAMAVNTGYTANRGTLITFTLPATAAYGSIMRIAGKGTGLYTIAQNAGQSIHFVNNGPISTTVGVGGSLSSIDQYGTIELLCSVADTDFTVLSMNGNFTPV